MYYAQEAVYGFSPILFDWRTPKSEEDTPMGCSHRPQDLELDTSKIFLDGLSYYLDNSEEEGPMFNCLDDLEEEGPMFDYVAEA